MKLEKIVLTGGPGAGKTSSLPVVKEAFEALGYKVIVVGETATEMKKSGVAPWNCDNFQLSRMKLQLEKERVLEECARRMGEEKVLIVCDRGAMDTKCYSGAERFAGYCDALGKSEVELRDSYGAVFHLESAGKGDTSYYFTGEGTDRTETPEESASQDDRLLSAWCGHPHVRIIPCEDSFEKKTSHLIEEIKGFLGEPNPLEIEKKYLIEYPDLSVLKAYPFCKKVEIEQTYIIKDGRGARIRRRGANGDYIYFLTEKRDITPTIREEVEREITPDEYEELMRYADPERRTIKKDRYCIIYKNKYFELDVYPFWRDRATLEIELLSEDEDYEIPDFLKVISDVTDDKEYRNYSLAKKQV